MEGAVAHDLHDPSARRRARDLESEVLAALWATDQPLTPGETVEAIGGAAAYATVRTILVRLLSKGVVQREPVGRVFAYSPVLDRGGVLARRLRAVLDSGGDHQAVSSRFLATLTEGEQHALVQLTSRCGRNSS